MRSIGLVLVAGLAVAGCDRASTPAGQEQASPDQMANAVSPDEAAPSGAVAAKPAGTIDRSHKGEAAPTLAFVDPEGKPVTLATYRGTPVLLNLWATWCGPCVKELPTLDALAVREGAKLRVVTLSQDMDPAKATAFLAERKFKALKSWTDPKMAWVPAVASNLPTSILFDAAGKEVWRTIGDLDWTGEAATKAVAEAG